MRFYCFCDTKFIIKLMEYLHFNSQLYKTIRRVVEDNERFEGGGESLQEIQEEAGGIIQMQESSHHWFLEQPGPDPKLHGHLQNLL